jgi:glycosyltransferase involved in cell wall biosynthesis
MAGLDLARTRRFEAEFSGEFDRVLVSAAGDASRFRALRPSGRDQPICVLPNGVDLERFHPLASATPGDTVLFTGKMSYHANEAAALRLVTRIMPLVWRRRPEAKVVIAGKDPGPEIRQLARDARVSVTGYVQDLRPAFWNAAVVAAPLVYGAGIQNKVLEAMACGVPVVASPQACEALAAVAGEDVLIGSTDEAMASDLVALLEDRSRREHVGMRGRAYVEAHHDWTRLARRLVAVYDDARFRGRSCA